MYGCFLVHEPVYADTREVHGTVVIKHFPPLDHQEALIALSQSW